MRTFIPPFLICLLLAACQTSRDSAYSSPFHLTLVSSLNTQLPDVTQYYLVGNATRRFSYRKDLGDGDFETGFLTYQVTGRFAPEAGRASYAMDSTLDMTVTYDYRNPLNIMHLPKPVLLNVYTKEQIEKVIRTRPLTNAEIQEMGIQGEGIGVTVREFDQKQAMLTFTSPIRASHPWHTGDNGSSASALFGNAHRHVDEACAVWIKDLLVRLELPCQGKLVTERILKNPEGLYVITMSHEILEWARQKPGKIKITCHLRKGAGLVFFEYHSPEGVHIALEEAPADPSR
ncbi:MAG: hypothetical protein V1809_15060 [Planctomycetota bacterium]